MPTAASAAQSDVLTAYNSCVDGDTLVIPPGTATWTIDSGLTGGLDITKAITLQGSGVGQTIIKDGITTAGNVITMVAKAGLPSRITGIEFQNNGAGFNHAPAIELSCTDRTISNPQLDGRSIRLDNCKFDHLNTFAIQTDDVIGVIDHNEFLSTSNHFFAYIYNKNWGGTRAASTYTSDVSQSDPTNLGSNQFLFIEDNILTMDVGAHYAVIDGYGGSRAVIRHNAITRGWIEQHGTESSQRFRGSRAIEIYNNTFIASGGGGLITNMRSGTGVIYNNTATGYINPVVMQFQMDREIASFPPFGQADGTNVWDVNLAGGPFYSGTATSAGSYTVTVSGATWTTNQWANYSILKTAGSSSPANYSAIRSNTSTQITFSNSGGFGDLTFTTGDTFQIWKVTHAIDQPGRVRGALLVGDPPTLPGGWNDQVTEPWYAWNNTYEGGAQILFGSVAGSVTAGVHYITDGSMKPGYTAFQYPHPLVTNGAPTATGGGFLF